MNKKQTRKNLISEQKERQAELKELNEKINHLDHIRCSAIEERIFCSQDLDTIQDELEELNA